MSDSIDYTSMFRLDGRIAIVTGPLSLKNERQRLLGYQQALERAGIALEESLVWNGNLLPDSVELMCRKRLEAAPRPDAKKPASGS